MFRAADALRSRLGSFVTVRTRAGHDTKDQRNHLLAH
jgi:hypothetical protein